MSVMYAAKFVVTSSNISLHTKYFMLVALYMHICTSSHMWLNINFISNYLWRAHMPSLLSMHTCVHTFVLAPSFRRAEMEVISSLRQANVNAV